MIILFKKLVLANQISLSKKSSYERNTKMRFEAKLTTPTL